MIWKKLKFDTSNPEVYPPKPATLLLAEAVTKIVKPNDKVLEVGTGSGAVAIAVAKFVQGTDVTASDINPEAINTVLINAKLNNIQLKTVTGDWYKPFKPNSFDVIVVHPPAVPYPKNKTWGLSKGMTVATNGGFDGSELVVRSITEAIKYLKPGGNLLLLLPHWSNTRKAYEALFKSYSSVSKVSEKIVEFFPAVEGNPTEELLDHVDTLANNGVIELWHKGGKMYSRVSVIQAMK